MPEIVESLGICGAGCACAGCIGGTIGGCLTWAYLVWPAMGTETSLAGLGQWLMTF